MMTTVSIVALITSLGWLILNWRSYRASAEQVGWSGSRQLALAAVWVAIFAIVALFIRFMGQ